MEKLAYSVTRKSYTGENLSSFPMNTNKETASKAAIEQAKTHPEELVFVTWYRPRDGQIGYYNRDGSHSVTGKAW